MFRNYDGERLIKEVLLSNIFQSQVKECLDFCIERKKEIAFDAILAFNGLDATHFILSKPTKGGAYSVSYNWKRIDRNLKKQGYVGINFANLHTHPIEDDEISNTTPSGADTYWGLMEYEENQRKLFDIINSSSTTNNEIMIEDDLGTACKLSRRYYFSLVPVTLQIIASQVRDSHNSEISIWQPSRKPLDFEKALARKRNIPEFNQEAASFYFTKEGQDSYKEFINLGSQFFATNKLALPNSTTNYNDLTFITKGHIG